MSVEDRVLDIVAVEVCLSNHGDFLRCFAEAWQRADPSNKALLREPWARLVKKYKLRDEYAEVIERELSPSVMGGCSRSE